MSPNIFQFQLEINIELFNLATGKAGLTITKIKKWTDEINKLKLFRN